MKVSGSILLNLYLMYLNENIHEHAVYMSVTHTQNHVDKQAHTDICELMTIPPTF